VVDVSAHRFRAGGAGLVAAMLHHDGHEVELVTALGDDEAARRIRERLPGVSIIACDSAAPTPVKRRVRTADQAVCRIDEGCGPPPVPRVDDLALAAVSRAEAIVVSDYGRRLTEHPELRAALQRRALRVPLVWDPHPRGTEPVSAARLVTPNIDEAAAAAGTGRGAARASEAAERLRERYGCAAVLVTLGELGALLHEGERAPVEITTDPVEAADPCGAGDRLISAAAAALRRGPISPREASPRCPSRRRSKRPPARRQTTRSPSPARCTSAAAPSSRPAAASICCTPGTCAPSRPRETWATASSSA
jgi:bifunctional ADP-heptose synthase (sugar kinase/adenylyltransferase)